MRGMTTPVLISRRQAQPRALVFIEGTASTLPWGRPRRRRGVAGLPRTARRYPYAPWPYAISTAHIAPTSLKPNSRN